MAKVSVATPDTARSVPPPRGSSGAVETCAMFDRERDPLHLHLHRLARGALLRLAPAAAHCLAYVWEGTVTAGGRLLTRGSSLIVESGGILEVEATEDASIVTFEAAAATADQPTARQVRLLPDAQVPRIEDMHGLKGMSGGLHADATDASSGLWLHESGFTAADFPTGLHAHSEAEVIFVTEGDVRLGARLFGPGTAVAIAADTIYSFSSGPRGIRFVNFRGACPRQTRWPDGRVADEAASWRSRVDAPRHLAPIVA